MPPELDNFLRHIVPPAVRALQDELRMNIQGIIQEEFSKISEKDQQMSGFLAQYGLPQALHSMTATNDVPNDVWAKIEEF